MHVKLGFADYGSPFAVDRLVRFNQLAQAKAIKTSIDLHFWEPGRKYIWFDELKAVFFVKAMGGKKLVGCPEVNLAHTLGYGMAEKRS